MEIKEEKKICTHSFSRLRKNTKNLGYAGLDKGKKTKDKRRRVTMERRKNYSGGAGGKRKEERQIN